MPSKDQLRQRLATADIDRLALMERVIDLRTELEAHRMALAHLCRVYIVSDEAWDQDADTIKAVERELNRFRPAVTMANVDREALEALRDIIEWFDAGDVESARECALRARHLLARSVNDSSSWQIEMSGSRHE